LSAAESVVFLSLQYPKHTFIAETLRRVAGLDLEHFGDRIAFIELDATMEGMERVGARHIRANLVRPSMWTKALEVAREGVPEEGPGVLGEVKEVAEHSRRRVIPLPSSI
jgi:hypothetical protein